MNLFGGQNAQPNVISKEPTHSSDKYQSNIVDDILKESLSKEFAEQILQNNKIIRENQF